MSSVAITDKRGGVYQVAVTFTYGECDRLPFNSLRKVKARIEQVNHGGIQATAEFNIRNGQDAANFVEVLDLFGEDGSFVHGSSADPGILSLEEPPDDAAGGLLSAATVSASMPVAEAASTESSPVEQGRTDSDTAPESAPEKAKGRRGRGKRKKKVEAAPPAEPEDLEVETEAEEEVVCEEEEAPDLETEEEAETEVEESASGR